LLKIGLVGCGYLGSRHLKHLCGIDDVELSGIWDSDPSTLAKSSSEFNVPAMRSLDDLIGRSDAIDIVTPTTTHCEIALKAVEAGLHLFVEKPVCATYSEGLELLEKADAAGVTIQVGHIERFNRAFRALGDLSIKPDFIEVHRLALWNPRGIDVAVVHDLMIHDLDLILALAQEFPADIYASGVSVVSKSIDIANARLEFASGLVANVTASRISLKKMRKFRMFGNNEYIALDLDKGTCEHVGFVDDEDDTPPGAEVIGELVTDDKPRILYLRPTIAEEGDSLKLQLEAFRDAITGGTAPPVTGRDGLMALKLAELIVEKIRER